MTGIRPGVSCAFLSSLLRIPGWLAQDSRPAPEAAIPTDFLGVNVAPSADPAVNDYTLERLADLGLRQVRMDFSYCGPGGDAQRYLDRLLAAGYQVLLNVFPPLEEARILHSDPGAARRWEEFLQGVFRDYRGRVALFEVGNTPNRGRWSGFSSPVVRRRMVGGVSRGAGPGHRPGGPQCFRFRTALQPGLSQPVIALSRARPAYTRTTSLWSEWWNPRPATTGCWAGRPLTCSS